MLQRAIPDHVVLVDYEKTGEMHYHKQDDNHYPIIKVRIDEDDRLYYVKYQEYQWTCGCSESRMIFGYNPNNNSLNVYCLHCHMKFPKGVSQVKNSCKRDVGSHSYFAQVQKDKDRFFCEICHHSDILDIHHIIEVKDDGSDEEDNLQLLCKHCHNLVHSIRKIKVSQ